MEILLRFTSFRMEHQEWHSMWKIWKSMKNGTLCFEDRVAV